MGIGSAIKQLWNEPIIKEIYALRNITCVEASSAHFWDKVMEIAIKIKRICRQWKMFCCVVKQPLVYTKYAFVSMVIRFIWSMLVDKHQRGANGSIALIMWLLSYS